MTWLAWRQLRTATLVAVLALAALAVVLVRSGTQVLHVYDTVVVACAVHRDCGPVDAHFQALAHLTHVFSTLLLVAPVLAGVFLGAPLLARELETGTYRLAWTQSVTRLRWIVVRLAMVALVAAVLTGLLSAGVTWWQQPIDHFNQTLYSTFEARDVVPVAYAVFAVALGALLGALLRRTIAAMAATLLGFVVVRYLVEQYVRPNLFSPLQVRSAFLGPPSLNDWVLSDSVVNHAGDVIGHYGGIGPNGNFDFNVSNGGRAVFTGVGTCPNRIPVPPGGIRSPHTSAAELHAAQAAIQHCVDSFGLREVLTYQPASRYWLLQWSETAIFLAIAVALGAGCVWWVRRRLP